jgi:predicted nicotinamide N-methyase
MAEVSIWSKDDLNSANLRKLVNSTCDVLRRECRKRKVSATIEVDDSICLQSPAKASVADDSLRELVVVLSAGGIEADLAANAFGRCGGHMFLLQLLEDASDNVSEDTIRLAETATELCMSLCPRFPMKATTVDAKNECDLMRCTVEINSELHASGEALSVHLCRRPNPSDTENTAVITISNMLWSGSIVLARYLQARPYLIPGVDFSATDSTMKNRILEIGAGLGLGGLGAAVLARHLRKAVDIHITDADPAAVDMICSSIRSNRFSSAPPVGNVDDNSRGTAELDCPVRTSASVLDWDKIDLFVAGQMGDGDCVGGQASSESIVQYELVLGAEVVHETSHAAGVLLAIRRLMAPHGMTIIVNAAPKHRFGAAEFQVCFCALAHNVRVWHSVAAQLHSSALPNVNRCHKYWSWSPTKNPILNFYFTPYFFCHNDECAQCNGKCIEWIRVLLRKRMYPNAWIHV